MLMQAISRYLAVRRASGFDLKGAAWTLASFARFAQSRGEEHVVADTAVVWASQAPSPPTRYKRLSDVRVLARYLRLEDPRNEIPPPGIFPSQVNRQTPYIFTEDEIRDLIGHASALGPEGSLRPLTYVTLFGLLAATGMRVGEALALRLDDLRSDHLRIRRAKFHKSRVVPLHTTTVAAMQRYLLRRRATGSSDPHVFLSLRRRKLSYGVTIETFHKVCEAARLPHRPSAHGLRLHDLRHYADPRIMPTRTFGGPQGGPSLTARASLRTRQSALSEALQEPQQRVAGGVAARLCVQHRRAGERLLLPL